MRLWSLHPRYLDSQGLVALWRESLLAQKVLKGKTHGYRSHPQLRRFRAERDPVAAIATYLEGIYRESVRRGYHFDQSKIDPGRLRGHGKIPVAAGQIEFELEHLRSKLSRRDRASLERIAALVRPRAHPLFRIVPGPVEAWERGRI
jgi:hypothetical protein